MAIPLPDSACLISLQGICKQFSGNAVLKGVDLKLHPGEIFALVGGNGAGKSTLMKIITGLYQPDSGTIAMHGRSVRIANPKEAHELGIYLVPQEPLIFPNMTVEENILIGMSEKTADLQRKLQGIMAHLSWNLRLDQVAGTLSIAEQQLVEILRGLIREAKILILDEPTSTLTFGEIASLFQTLRRLCDQSMGIFYITHRFSEIFQLAHTVAVLRDGMITAAGPVQNFTHQMLLEGLLPPQAAQPSKAADQPTAPQAIEPSRHTSADVPLLAVHGLSGKGFHELSFQVHHGEVFGIAGVVGAGRTELAEAIFGVAEWDRGDVLLDGASLKRRSIRQRIKDGLVYVPEDRHAHGIFSIAGISQNMTSTILHRLTRWFLPHRKEREVAQEFIGKLQINCTGERQQAGSLSGGNQQKVVLAKYLAAAPKLMILDEPTRGIDASARSDIYRIISEIRQHGMGVILISSDLEEIVQLSDRVMVMFEGKMTAMMEKPQITVDSITTAAFGVSKEVAAVCH
ncbi:autoinducer 2 ABC transporter ATP-binding protein LsrA [Brevibacillus sp. B_LB10_24]|uniref:autoinducer 2 ABC transporter ATP-binding protein LsrA n=1 Tax=Brevibacillus sp. B_LB10_24 TaxID=3380645 RepID=UPI0038B7A509